jgi:ABC-2 type transport system permease protein/sodium transport system permease protein
VERFFPTTFMGIVLGFVAVRTGSIWPGMLLHALHNGLLLSMGYYKDQLERLGILVEEQQHLPTEWLIGGGLALATGMLLIWLSTRPKREPAMMISAPVA